MDNCTEGRIRYADLQLILLYFEDKPRRISIDRFNFLKVKQFCPINC
jgi:hypothetical protein